MADETNADAGAGGDDNKIELDEHGQKIIPVKVKSWHAVAYWAFDYENDTCAVCRNQLMVPCITCEAEPAHQAEECTIAWGQCGHCFHFHCISRWLKTRSTCPLDDTEWDFVKY